MATIENGSRIYLNDDQCEALGITKTITPGTQVSLSGKAIVVSATESVEADGDDSGNDISLCIQITDLDLTSGRTVTNAASVLYGEYK